MCVSVCVPAVSWLEAVSPLGWLGCELSVFRGSLIMPDRLIRGESCCVSITTDRLSVSPLNLSHHTGRQGVQAGAERRGQAWSVSRKSAERQREQGWGGCSTVSMHERARGAAGRGCKTREEDMELVGLVPMVHAGSPRSTDILIGEALPSPLDQRGGWLDNLQAHSPWVALKPGSELHSGRE